MATCEKQDHVMTGRLFTVFSHIAALKNRHCMAFGATYFNEKETDNLCG